MKDEHNTPHRKPGPLRRNDTRLTSMLLQHDLIEWAKHQPGGLSETVRVLLEEAHNRYVAEEQRKGQEHDEHSEDE